MNVQRDATICSLYFILLQDHSTCFGCRLHPSSGVRKTVVTATGTSRMIVHEGHFINNAHYFCTHTYILF